MSRDVLCRVSGPALGWRNRLSLRSGPATSLLAQNRAKSGDSWASRAGRAVQGGFEVNGHRSPVHGDMPGGLLFPVGDQGAPVGLGEAKVQHVRGAPRPRAEVTEQHPGWPVVGQDVEPGRDGVRRGWFKALHASVSSPRPCAAAPVRSSQPWAWSSGSRACAVRAGQVVVAPTLAYDHAAILGEPWSVPTELAARVSVPALVMAGDTSLPFMPDAARVLSQAIPQGQLRMLAGQTHEVNPGVLAPVLVEFFTS